MDFNTLYYGAMLLGYLVGIYLGRSPQSISYLLFLTCLYLVFALFKIAKSFYAIENWESLTSGAYLNGVVADVVMYLSAFGLGCAASYLFSMRIIHAVTNKYFRLVLSIPPISILSLFLRYSKTSEIKFRITKFNATPILTIAVGCFFLQPELDSRALEAQNQYYQKLQQATNDTAVKIAEAIKKNRGFPYIYEEGYLQVFELDGVGGVVQFKMRETEPNLFNWGNEDLDTWLVSELCRQQTIIDNNISDTLSVFISFQVFDNANMLRLEKQTYTDTCKS